MWELSNQVWWMMMLQWHGVLQIYNFLDARNWTLRLHSYCDLVSSEFLIGTWKLTVWHCQWLLYPKKFLCNLCIHSLSYLWLLKAILMFPGVLLRPGETVKCNPGELCCHISQVCFMRFCNIWSFFTYLGWILSVYRSVVRPDCTAGWQGGWGCQSFCES